MAVRLDRSAEPGVIRLEGAVDIDGAAELKVALLEAVRSGRAARISLAGATSLDVTAMQLLWAAEREATATGAVLALDGPVPEALSAAMREAGFERFPFAGATTDEGQE